MEYHTLQPTNNIHNIKPICLVSGSISVGSFIRVGTFPVYLVSKGPGTCIFFISLYVTWSMLASSLAGRSLFLTDMEAPWA